MNLKLNTKRTVLVGLAFLSISAFWQLYDFVIPLVLKNTYQVGDTVAGVVMAMDNILALFLLPFFGSLSDKCHAKLGRRMPFIIGGTAASAAVMLCLPMVIKNGNPQNVWMFMACLAVLLVAMGTYRSPAVALMPDVTPKPLRSKGNAVINLMGAVGGLFSLAMVNVAVVKEIAADGTERSDYTWLFVSVAALMVICVVTLVLTIRERKLVGEMEAINYGETADEEKGIHAESSGKLSKPAFRSLVLILCSVSLWFMGYNAITTAFSKYATTMWHVTEGAAARCVMVGTVGAILCYWPVGILSSKVGRKRMIQVGILMLAASFLAGALLPDMSPVLYVLFALVGAGWAAINVNSFPMVVELATGSDTGKYTGYYYTFSMAAQVITPILSGALMEHVSYRTLFPYACICVLMSFVTMCFVKHGDSKPEAKKGLEAFEGAED